MSELKRRLFKVVGDAAGQSEAARVEPIEEVREGIAQLLKQTREGYGQSLRDVSANLRIRMAYLQAIESGRFRELPGPTYAIGFVRSYAEYLGLDAAEIVRRFKGEVEGLESRTHLAFPEPVPEGKVPGGAIIVISLLVLIVGYGGWYAITARDADGVGLIPRLSENLKALIGTDESTSQGIETVAEPAPEPAAVAPSSPAPAEAGQPAPASSPAPAEPTSPSASPAGAPALTDVGEGASAPLLSVPDRAPAAMAPESPLPDASAQEVAIGSTEEEDPTGLSALSPESGLPAAPAIPEAPRIETIAAAPAAADDPANAGQILLRARIASWIQISDAAGQPILTRTLGAGESVEIPSRPGLTLFTGNAGGLDIVVGGRILPPLGPVGAVRRGISLDPDALGAAQASE